ncbi:MAG TPA: ABC transporter ATP-binding protein [Deinococcales bacterium]|nr:ABC transporter ATP-binding protein [Deinococcales bacterium]
MNAIEIRDLVVQYGSKRAVDGLSLTVPQGSVFGFLGPNGSGKTTTIKTLLGIRRPDGGQASILGHDVVSDSLAVRARTGFVSEVGGLYDGLTVTQMLDFQRGTAAKWDKETAEHYIETFKLPRGARVRQLSKGMKMQLAFALAMGNSPDLLILDEPTSGLDPVARHELLNTLVGEVAATGRTVFFSSHILSEVEAVADTIAIIRGGKLIVSGDLDDLKAQQKVVRLVYVDAPPREEVEAVRALPGIARVDQEGRSLRLTTRGGLNGILEALRNRPYPVRDVDVVDIGLEDLFLEYMKEAVK